MDESRYVVRVHTNIEQKLCTATLPLHLIKIINHDDSCPEPKVVLKFVGEMMREDDAMVFHDKKDFC